MYHLQLEPLLNIQKLHYSMIFLTRIQYTAGSTVAGNCWFRLSSGLMMINANDFRPSSAALAGSNFTLNLDLQKKLQIAEIKFMTLLCSLEF